MARLPDIGASGQPAPQPAMGVAGFDPRSWRQYGEPAQLIEAGGRELQEVYRSFFNP